MTASVASLATQVNGSTGDTVTVSKPSGLEVGDLLLAVVGVNRHSAAAIATPSGWTAGAGYLSGANFADVATYGKYAFLTKTANASDVAATSFAFTANDASYHMCAVLLRVIHHLAVDGSACGRFANTSSPVTLTDGISQSAGGRLFVVAAMHNAGGSISTVGAPAMTTDDPTWTDALGTTSFAGGNWRIRVSYAERESASATGNITQTTDASPSTYGVLGGVSISPAPPVEMTADGTIQCVSAQPVLKAGPSGELTANGTMSVVAGQTYLHAPTGAFLKASGSIGVDTERCPRITARGPAAAVSHGVFTEGLKLGGSAHLVAEAAP